MDEWENAGRRDQLKYLGSTQTKDGTSTEDVKIRLVQIHSAMTRLAILWKNNVISLPTEIKLFKLLVLSILLNGCDSWTLMLYKNAWHIKQRT